MDGLSDPWSSPDSHGDQQPGDCQHKPDCQQKRGLTDQAVNLVHLGFAFIHLGAERHLGEGVGRAAGGGGGVFGYRRREARGHFPRLLDVQDAYSRQLSECRQQADRDQCEADAGQRQP